MSHVATIDLDVKDLDALAEACRNLGLELVRGQTSYKWWGQSVGDYPIPAGFTADDLGKCEHAIRSPTDGSMYEVGVVRRRDGRPGYTLLWDFIDSRLVNAIGQRGARLKVQYARAVAIQHARRSGWRVTEQQRADGSVQLMLSR